MRGGDVTTPLVLPTLRPLSYSVCIQQPGTSKQSGSQLSVCYIREPPSSLILHRLPPSSLILPLPPPPVQVLGLALAQHERVVTQALAAQQQSSALCEGLMKQHARCGRGSCEGGGGDSGPGGSTAVQCIVSGADEATCTVRGGGGRGL